MVCVGSTALQSNLIDQILNFGGYEKGGWYAVPSRDAVLSVMESTKDMGGNVFWPSVVSNAELPTENLKDVTQAREA
jgi:hypothetical protein